MFPPHGLEQPWSRRVADARRDEVRARYEAQYLQKVHNDPSHRVLANAYHQQLANTQRPMVEQLLHRGPILGTNRVQSSVGVQFDAPHGTQRPPTHDQGVTAGPPQSKSSQTPHVVQDMLVLARQPMGPDGPHGGHVISTVSQEELREMYKRRIPQPVRLHRAGLPSTHAVQHQKKDTAHPMEPGPLEVRHDHVNTPRKFTYADPVEIGCEAKKQHGKVGPATPKWRSHQDRQAATDLQGFHWDQDLRLCPKMGPVNANMVAQLRADQAARRASSARGRTNRPQDALQFIF